MELSFDVLPDVVIFGFFTEILFYEVKFLEFNK